MEWIFIRFFSKLRKRWTLASVRGNRIRHTPSQIMLRYYASENCDNCNCEYRVVEFECWWWVLLVQISNLEILFKRNTLSVNDSGWRSIYNSANLYFTSIVWISVSPIDVETCLLLDLKLIRFPAGRKLMLFFKFNYAIPLRSTET